MKLMLMTVFALYIGIGILLTVNQEKRIYFPSKDCSIYNLDNGDTRFYYESVGSSLIVFYHGNAGSVCDRQPLIERFRDRGYSVLFVEYSGYGDTMGNPTNRKIKDNVKETVDIIGTLEHEEVIVVGESIGTGPASLHASTGPVDKLILISPFTSIADIAKRLMPIYPMSLMIRDDFRNIDYLKDYDNPLLILHGVADRIVPKQYSEPLCTGENCRRTLIKAGHNDMYDRPKTWDEIWGFLDEEQV